MVRHARLLVAPGDEHVPDLRVALEVDQPVAVHPQHELELLLTHRGRRVVMPGRVDDDLARPARADLVVHADALAHEIPLDAEVGVRFGQHPHLPARRVRRAAVLAVGRDLGRRRALGTRAEHTLSPRFEPRRRPDEHPPPARRILSQLAHGVLRVPTIAVAPGPAPGRHNGTGTPFMRDGPPVATPPGRAPAEPRPPAARADRHRKPGRQALPARTLPSRPRATDGPGAAAPVASLRVSPPWPNQSKSTARRPEGPAARRKSFFRPREWRTRTSTCSRTRPRGRSWSA